MQGFLRRQALRVESKHKQSLSFLALATEESGWYYAHPDDKSETPPSGEWTTEGSTAHELRVQGFEKRLGALLRIPALGSTLFDGPEGFRVAWQESQRPTGPKTLRCRRAKLQNPTPNPNRNHLFGTLCVRKSAERKAFKER